MSDHRHDWLSGNHAYQCACGAWEEEANSHIPLSDAHCLGCWLARHDEYAITDETVEQLRRGGSPKDLVEFADRHVKRYSRKDMDGEFWLGGQVAIIVMFTLGIVAVVVNEVVR